jgi:LmbE family N-acetylglucosaminyl deacetylase
MRRQQGADMPTANDRPGPPPVDLLWILAHPDDETFGSAGTMAWARDRGLRTAYICATRGEAGMIRDSDIATQETLGAIREQELRTAMSLVGLSELRMLGFRDSGMENTVDNDDPRALIQQSEEALVAHLVGHIRDLRPTTVITFGPEGIYGHPDHILVGRVADLAVELAADPTHLPKLHQPWRVTALYHGAVPREMMLEMADHPDQPLGEISERSRQNLGTPDEQITHRLDISTWLAVKRQAIAAHRTQTAGREGGESPEDTAAVETRANIEYYARQPLPWDPEMTAEDPLTRAEREIGAVATASESAR